jgi:hypothetical protein
MANSIWRLTIKSASRRSIQVGEPASPLLNRRAGRTRVSGRSRIKYARTVGQFHGLRIGEVRPILGRGAIHDNQVALFQGVAPPSAAHQEIRAAELAIPLCHFAGLVLHFHVNPGVRINPLQLDERAFELHRFFGVELRREGVMRDCRRAEQCG